ncbi:hypothetical protein [Cyanobium gracile]|uniref:Uncharacterized protein n=1 Tax=Cyanobium gracile UHCC 0281 TaxID=3110309 RepID=A0ABU5SYG2_9CYAN|nr:hypothetical protein [Cyanobium gracile]MEA5443558.1 hypothetical protein [Cyanobium gracile UHCC 0281]
MTIFLTENQKLSFLVPEQRDDLIQRTNLFKDILTNNKFVIEANGTLFCIPWTSIKYLQLDPIAEGDVLPSPVLKGLHIID